MTNLKTTAARIVIFLVIPVLLTGPLLAASGSAPMCESALLSKRKVKKAPPAPDAAPAPDLAPPPGVEAAPPAPEAATQPVPRIRVKAKAPSTQKADSVKPPVAVVEAPRSAPQKALQATRFTAPKSGSEKLVGRLMTDREMKRTGLDPNRSPYLDYKLSDVERAQLLKSISLMDHVTWVEETLKEKFVGWDKTTTSLMSAVKAMVSFPDSNENLTGPIFVPIMTLPGYGKTTYVRAFVELLAQHPDLAYLKNEAKRFTEIKLEGDNPTPFLDLRALFDAGVKGVNPARPITKIILWDEIQNLMSLDDLADLKKLSDAIKLGPVEEPVIHKNPEDAEACKKETEAARARAVADLEKKKLQLADKINMMNKSLKESQQIQAKFTTIEEFQAKRKEMIDILWDIFGNGVAKRHLEKDADTKIKEIQTFYDASFKQYWRNYQSALDKKEYLEKESARSAYILPELQEELATLQEAIKNGDGKDDDHGHEFYFSSYSSPKERLRRVKEKLDREQRDANAVATQLQNIDNLITQTQNAYKVQSGIEGHMLPKFELLCEEHPKLLAKLDMTKVSDLVKFFIDNPPEALDKLKELAPEINSEEYVDYRRMIIIAAGNPPKFIELLDSQSNTPLSEMDPDQAHRIAISIGKRPDVTTREFQDKFGTSAAMASRLNVSDWAPLPPFNKSQWMKLIENRMRESIRVFQTEVIKQTMPNIGTDKKKSKNLTDPMDLELSYDDSVRMMLEKRAIKIQEGPRITLKKTGALLNSIEYSLPRMLRKLPEDSRLWASNRVEIVKEVPSLQSPIPPRDHPAYDYKIVNLDGKFFLVRHWKKVKLVVSFDDRSNSLVVREEQPAPIETNTAVVAFSPEEKGLFSKFKISLKEPFQTKIALEEAEEKTEKATRTYSQPTVEKKRQVLFQAARAVIGMTEFKSIPNFVKPSSVNADQALSEMWHKPDQGHLDYMLAECKALLAAYVMEQTDPELRRVTQSKQSKTELILLANEYVDNLVVELVERRQLSAFRLEDVEKLSANLKEILPPDMAENPAFQTAYRLSEGPRAEAGEANTRNGLLQINPKHSPLKAQLLRYLYNDVLNTIRNQHAMIEAIAAKIAADKEISSSELSVVVQKYYKNRSAPPDMPWYEKLIFAVTIREEKKQILSNPPGIPVRISIPDVRNFEYESKKKQKG